jgi:hypothetical protein
MSNKSGTLSHRGNEYGKIKEEWEGTTLMKVQSLIQGKG